MRGLRVTIATLVAAGATAVPAGADGLPVGGIEVGPSGVTRPDDAVRYVALRAGPDTVVARVEQEGGRVLGNRLLDGRFTIPAVALDGTAAGLSADGSTLVLIRPRRTFPRQETALAVVDTARLRLRETITLAGDFSFDALSPDGSLLYLVQYVAPRDPTRYVVRGYDLDRGRLLPKPVVDPKVFGDVMRGYPVTRAVSPDGRWAYTLYDGGGGHPFVHALDTAERTAACIVVEALAGRDDLLETRLAVAEGGREVRVVAGRETVAVIDAVSLRLSEPSLPSPQAAAVDADASAPWAFAAGFAVLLLAGAAGRVFFLRRRRRPAAI
ncbi:MAG: hypothetical protein ACRDNI_13650 [Gaiellaceae bacterium]